VWLPYGDRYLYAPAGSDPYAYVYYPAFGWRWAAAPWFWDFGWGWGGWPYYSHYRPWYGGWWRGHYYGPGVRPAPWRPGMRAAPAAPAPPRPRRSPERGRQ